MALKKRLPKILPREKIVVMYGVSAGEKSIYGICAFAKIKEV